MGGGITEIKTNNFFPGNYDHNLLTQSKLQCILSNFRLNLYFRLLLYTNEDIVNIFLTELL